MDEVLANARLVDGRLVDVTVAGGQITAVEEHRPGRGQGPDLGGWLLLPAMVEPHAHLDKALTADQVPNPRGDLLGAIDAWIEAARAGRFTHDEIAGRSRAAMEKLLVHGVTAVRTHVNVDPGVVALRAVQEAARSLEGLLDVQTVALPSSPLTGSEGAPNRQALDEAVEAGVDLVGGCPHLDPDPPTMIRHALTVAEDAGLPVDLHVDEMLDPDVLTLRELARQVRDRGFPHPVAASHCVTLGMQPPEVQTQVAGEVAEAGIAVFPLPQTNLFLQGRDRPTATPRGLTAVQALLDAGVVVAAGADNVQDPFNLVGRSDPLETAALMVMAAHQPPDTAYDMVSKRAAIGLAPVTLRAGDPADVVAVDAPSVRGAIADAPANRRVFRRGREVASTSVRSAIHREHPG